MTYSLITLLIITEYSDSARVWNVGGFWTTTRWAEQKKQKNAQALQQKEATIHRLQSDVREKDLQIQHKNDVITQQQRVITGYRVNPSRLIEGDVTGEESKEEMLIQLNQQSKELAEGVTVILV